MLEAATPSAGTAPAVAATGAAQTGRGLARHQYPGQGERSLREAVSASLCHRRRRMQLLRTVLSRGRPSLGPRTHLLHPIGWLDVIFWLLPMSRIRLCGLRHHSTGVTAFETRRPFHQVLETPPQLLQTLGLGLVDAFVLDVLGLGHRSVVGHHTVVIGYLGCEKNVRKF